MATRTNYVPNPSFEVDLSKWSEYNDGANLSSWRDTTNKVNDGVASLRINNGVTGDYGRKSDAILLPAGTYTASAFAQILAGTTNAVFVVRRQSDFNVYVEQHWTSPNNLWTRKNGTFTITTPTFVEIIAGVGSYGAASGGSARFDCFMIEEGTTLGTYFDGNTPSTSTIAYRWTGTPNASSSTAGDPVGSSPTPAPYLGWDLVETNDFSTTGVNGAGTSLDTSRFYIKNGFAGTSGDGYYHTDRVSVSGGAAIITPDQDWIGGFDSQHRPMVYGAWEVTFEWDAAPGYKPVIFLWPDSEKWPEGELDFVEMVDSTGQSFTIFFHNAKGSPSINQVVKKINTSITDGPVKVRLEWLSDHVRVLVNDQEVLYTTDKAAIPTTPMHLVIQMDVGIPNGHNGVSARAGYPANLSPRPVLRVYQIDIYKPSTTPPPSGGGGGGGTSGNTTLVDQVKGVWTGIKHRYVRSDGAVMQKEADNKVTSEGQGYAAVQAAVLEDWATLDLVELFSTNVLERRNHGLTVAPNLMAWDYRVNPFNSNPANTVNDWNFATDGDKDRCRGLLWAWAKTKQQKYLDKALAIARDLYDYGEAQSADGNIISTSDAYQKGATVGTLTAGHHTYDAGGGVLHAVGEVNPSYIDIALDHLIKDVGRDDRWDKVILGDLEVYTKATDNTAPLASTAGLFPDWLSWDFTANDASALTAGSQGWTYSRGTDQKYDGFRAPIRAVWAFDWYKEPSIPTILAPLKAFYASEWASQGKIAAEYDHAGNRLSGGYENSIMTEAAVMVLTCNDPNNATAAAIKAAKLDPATQYAIDGEGYAYWHSGPAGGDASYFGDFWNNFYYMREAGLLQNFGQTTTSTGSIPLASIEDLPTVVDEGTLNAGVSLSSVEDVPVAIEDPELYGSDPYGAKSYPIDLVDRGDLTVEHALVSTDDGGSNDTGDLYVPGQVDEPAPPVVITMPKRDRWLWVSKTRGQSLELTGFVDSLAMVQGAAGIYGPPSTIVRSVVPGQPGAITRSIRHDVKKLAIPLVGHTVSIQTIQNLIGQMVRLMDPVTNDAVLRYEAADGHVSELTCQVTDGLEVSSIGELGPTGQAFDLTIEAEDPYWYGEVVTLAFKGGQSKGWFPITPLQVGSSSVIGDIEVVTASDVETWPLWTLVGPGSNPSFVNNTTKKTLAMNAGLQAGETISIDTRPRGDTARTVKGPHGENWFGKLTRRSLWSLRPGRNLVNIGVVGATSETYVSLTYRDAKLLP